MRYCVIDSIINSSHIILNTKKKKLLKEMKKCNKILSNYSYLLFTEQSWQIKLVKKYENIFIEKLGYSIAAKFLLNFFYHK